MGMPSEKQNERWVHAEAQRRGGAERLGRSPANPLQWYLPKGWMRNIRLRRGTNLLRVSAPPREPTFFRSVPGEGK